MKTLILYYSYQGNTKRIAEMLQKEIGADIARIETIESYSGSYNQVVEQGKKEIESGYCPKLKPLAVNLADYDTIILGAPVWWYTFAPAMHTFLRDNDLSGKTIYPFATNGGWIGHTLDDFAKIKGADVKQGLNIRFDQSTLRTSEKEISKWAQTICK